MAGEDADVIRDRLRTTEMERSALRLRLAATAVASTLLILDAGSVTVWAAVLLPVYAIAASALAFVIPRAPWAWLPLAGSALDLLAATGFALLLPLDRPAWVLYLFAIGAAAARYGAHGAVIATALSLVGFDVALALRSAEADTGPLLAVQVLLAAGLIAAEMAHARRRDLAEREQLARHLAALRKLAVDEGSEQLLGDLVREVHTLAAAEAAWVWVVEGDGSVRAPVARGPLPPSPDVARLRALARPGDALPLRGLSGSREGEGVAVRACALPDIFVGVALSGADTERRLGLARDLVNEAAPLLAAALARERDRERIAGLHEQHDRLQEAVRARDVALATAAHELRNPLTAVHGYAQLMGRHLGAVQAQVAQLERLIADLLRAGGSEASGLELALEEVDVRGEVEAAIARLRVSGQAEVSLEAAHDLPAVRADHQRVAQVLDNVLQNAVKYSPADAPIVVRASAQTEEVVISVVDRGSGIAPQDLPFVFDRFYRGGNAGLSPGRGLGLAIAKDLVLAQGGRIWAESDGAGRGATISVALPVAALMARAGSGAGR